MKDLSLDKKTRRSFLKNASKTSIAVAVGGLALAGCGSTSNKFSSSSAKKKEILYRSSQYWNSYYKSAK